MQQRLTLITLGAENLKELTAFYREVLGWQPSSNSNDQITFFQLNGIQLAVYGKKALAEDAQIPPGGSGFKGFTLAHNLHSETEVDQLFEELKSKQVTVLKEPEKVFWGGYSGYFADPEDNIWEVAYNPHMKFDEKGNVVDI